METEHPELPVSIEIAELCKVLDEIYHYHIDVFEILNQKSHAIVSKKINAFVDIKCDSRSEVNIVYYAGHSKLITQAKRSCLVKVSSGSSFSDDRTASHSFCCLLLITANLIQLAGKGESEVFHYDLDWNPTRIRTGG
jgi:hypothetical protein